MKILIADDDSVLRAELAGLLREDGHDVVGASDGAEGLRLVERESAPSEGLQAMLESLANPRRRALGGYVVPSGPPVSNPDGRVLRPNQDTRGTRPCLPRPSATDPQG